MPAEQFKPMPQPDPEELPREKTRMVNVEELRRKTKQEKPEEEEMELTEADLEEIEEIPEVSAEEIGLELIEEPSTAEMRSVESKEGESRLIVGAATEASPDHPDRNEDAFFQSPRRGVQAVFDGMGGVPAGDFASHEAAKQLTREGLENADPVVKKVFEAERDEELEQDEVEKAMDAVIRQMNSAVGNIGTENPEVHGKAVEYFQKELGAYDENNPAHKKMLETVKKSIGCTASVSKMWRGPDGKHKLTIGQIGDSRVYRLRGGKLEKLSKEDSIFQVLADGNYTDINGEPIPKDDSAEDSVMKKSELVDLIDKEPMLRPYLKKVIKTPGSEVRLGDIRNVITQAVGVADVMKKEYGMEFSPNVSTHDLEDGDKILTISDGVGDNLTEDEIAGIMLLHDDPLKASQELQKESSLRAIKGEHSRAKKDDTTALISSFKKS